MEQLKQIIQASDRTQQDWADAIGISRPMLSMILSGKAHPSRRVIGLIDCATEGAVPPAAWFTRAAE
jgi:transcriptional regulator with XRE-family HTH domain